MKSIGRRRFRVATVASCIERQGIRRIGCHHRFRGRDHAKDTDVRSRDLFEEGDVAILLRPYLAGPTDDLGAGHAASGTCRNKAMRVCFRLYCLIYFQANPTVIDNRCVIQSVNYQWLLEPYLKLE